MKNPIHAYIVVKTIEGAEVGDCVGSYELETVPPNFELAKKVVDKYKKKDFSNSKYWLIPIYKNDAYAILID
jgi:hypothetical protein